MSRVVLYCLCVAGSGLAGHLAFSGSEVNPTNGIPNATLRIQTHKLAYYVPEQRGCASWTAGSCYGFDWVRGWEYQGKWYAKNCKGEVVNVTPVEIRRDTPAIQCVETLPVHPRPLSCASVASCPCFTSCP